MDESAEMRALRLEDYKALGRFLGVAEMVESGHISGSRLFEAMLDILKDYRKRQQEQRMNPLKAVVKYERISNNNGEKTVAHLECGHTRTFEVGYYPKNAVCWECPKKDTEKEKV